MKCDSNLMCLEEEKAFEGKTRVYVSELSLKAENKEI